MLMNLMVAFFLFVDRCKSWMKNNKAYISFNLSVLINYSFLSFLLVFVEFSKTISRDIS